MTLPNIERDLDWISTLGGPLVMLERVGLESWQGDDGSDCAVDSNANSDYERAGEIRDFVGSLDVNGRSALIFSMPNETASISIKSDLIVIVRLIWAPSREHVNEALRSFSLDQSWASTRVNAQFDTKDLIIFDSVYPGKEISEYIAIEVEPGLYKASTLTFQPDTQTNLLVIKLERS